MLELVLPDEIEKRSFEIILSELSEPLDEELAPLALRAIHATADFSYANSLKASQGAVAKAVAALRRGATIVTDTFMALAGIDKTRLAVLGGSALCYAKDLDVAEAAKLKGITRSMAAVEKARCLPSPLIFAVGNAPTALARICELSASGELSPDFVLGAPVGFVNVLESKEMLMQSGIPHVAACGRKGGSSVAAAIMNALIRLAAEN
jgi:precorrin-8X/cobalt-precorrin-8 methylmutase